MRFIKVLIPLLVLVSFAFTANEIDYVETGVNPDTWITIPAGDFFFGQHEHVKTTAEYEIMATHVTNEQYATFLNAALEQKAVYVKNDTVWGFHPGDPFDAYLHEFEIPAGDYPLAPIDEPGFRLNYSNGKFAPVKGWGNHPMVEVSWFGANAYAQFYGYRLPLETEWEKAARGTGTRPFPWGDHIEKNRTNFISSHNLFEKMFGDVVKTTPVGFYNGETHNGYKTLDNRSPYGLYDMAGNVKQWVGDDHKYVHYRYMRGGNYGSYELYLRVWVRDSAGPEHTSMKLGFRCARNPVVEVETAPADSVVTE